jgi:pimeloyl-ACP methyl ester carboxylesterase
VRVDEHTIELDSAPAFYRSAGAPRIPALYLHGIPTSSDDWLAPLARTGGLAVDMIGFGRSSKAAHLDYSIGGLADFVHRLLAWLDVERHSLVAHGWGVPVALELALRDPSRITRMALVSPPPLVEGFRWPRQARMLRTRGLGEFAMGATNRRLLALALRRASTTVSAWPDERLASAWEQFDQGTQRATLRLLRHSDEHWVSARSGALGQLSLPTLILHGARDPWLAPGLAEAYAALVPGGRREAIADAGHWPWLDRPDAIDTLQAFLESSPCASRRREGGSRDPR